MRHPDGRFGTHEQIAAEARQEANDHDQAAKEADAEAREHSRLAQDADRKGDHRTAVRYQRSAQTLRLVSRGHKDMASRQRDLALHHSAKVEPAQVLKRAPEPMKTVTPLSAREFFHHFR